MTRFVIAYANRSIRGVANHVGIGISALDDSLRPEFDQMMLFVRSL